MPEGLRRPPPSSGAVFAPCRSRGRTGRKVHLAGNEPGRLPGILPEEIPGALVDLEEFADEIRVPCDEGVRCDDDQDTVLYPCPVDQHARRSLVGEPRDQSLTYAPGVLPPAAHVFHGSQELAP